MPHEYDCIKIRQTSCYSKKRTLGYGISNSTVTCRLIKFKPDGNRGLEPIEVPK